MPKEVPSSCGFLKELFIDSGSKNGVPPFMYEINISPSVLYGRREWAEETFLRAPNMQSKKANQYTHL